MNENNMPDAGDVGMFAALGTTIILIYLGIYLFYTFCLFKIFKKAGREDAWAAFVPLYNCIVLLQVVGKPLWWIVMFLIPCANIVFLVMMNIELGARFGKDTAWSVALLVIFSFIGIPVLAFGDAQYTPSPTTPPASSTV